MALHNGIDTVAFVSFGVFTKTYGSADGGNIANLFVSRGLLEDAPDVATESPNLVKLNQVVLNLVELVKVVLNKVFSST